MNTTIKLTLLTRQGKKGRTYSFPSRASLDAYLKARNPQFYQIWAL